MLLSCIGCIDGVRCKVVSYDKVLEYQSIGNIMLQSIGISCCYQTTLLLIVFLERRVLLCYNPYLSMTEYEFPMCDANSVCYILLLNCGNLLVVVKA